MPDVHVPLRRTARPGLAWAAPGLAVLAIAGPSAWLSGALGLGITALALFVWCALAAWSLVVRGPLPAALVALAPLGAAPFWHVPLAELETASRATLERARDRGVAAVDADELRAWSHAHAVAAAGAWLAGFPEAASAAWAARAPGPDERWFDGAFALADPRVRRAVVELIEHPELTPPSVSWPSYDREPRARRVVAALDCPAWPRRSDDGVELRCRVDHRASAPVVLARVNGHRLTFDAGVFHLLEERGLLHPYTAVYAASVGPGDPRLQPDAPMEVGVREVTAAAIYAWMSAEDG